LRPEIHIEWIIDRKAFSSSANRPPIFARHSLPTPHILKIKGKHPFSLSFASIPSFTRPTRLGNCKHHEHALQLAETLSRRRLIDSVHLGRLMSSPLCYTPGPFLSVPMTYPVVHQRSSKDFPFSSLETHTPRDRTTRSNVKTITHPISDWPLRAPRSSYLILTTFLSIA
jgi:hypothetical protein